MPFWICITAGFKVLPFSLVTKFEGLLQNYMRIVLWSLDGQRPLGTDPFGNPSLLEQPL